MCWSCKRAAVVLSHSVLTLDASGRVRGPYRDLIILVFAGDVFLFSASCVCGGISVDSFRGVEAVWGVSDS